MLDTFSGATRIYPIVGDPIAQVKAPAGVTRAFEAAGVDAVCVPMQVAPIDFGTFILTMRRTRNVDGIIVTVPHKFAAFDACDDVTERARFLRSVNTITRGPDGRLTGDMLDGLGFLAACQEKGADLAGKRALLVGVGGAGTAIAHAVAGAGLAELALADLDLARRDELVRRLRAAGLPVVAARDVIAGYDLVFNATPLGMRPGDPLPVRLDLLAGRPFVGDVVTKPEISPLIAEARRLGCLTSTGSDMFAKVRDLMVAFLLGRPKHP